MNKKIIILGLLVISVLTLLGLAIYATTHQEDTICDVTKRQAIDSLGGLKESCYDIVSYYILNLSCDDLDKVFSIIELCDGDVFENATMNEPFMCGTESDINGSCLE